MEIPIWQKMNLTIREAAQYSNIGENTLRDYINRHPEADFIAYVGNKVLIKKKQFEQWNDLQYIIR